MFIPIVFKLFKCTKYIYFLVYKTSLFMPIVFKLLIYTKYIFVCLQNQGVYAYCV